MRPIETTLYPPSQQAAVQGLQRVNIKTSLFVQGLLACNITNPTVRLAKRYDLLTHMLLFSGQNAFVQRRSLFNWSCCGEDDRSTERRPDLKPVLFNLCVG